MKQIFRLIPALLLCILPLSLRAEYIFTTDGAIHKGKIIKENATTVTISTDDNEKETYKRTDIMRILYTKLNMGKIYVQRKNGDNFTAYMVDEDQETYTFRNDLYKPEEFKLERMEVLFIAERNPSALKGKPDTQSIDLTWYHPYDPMEKYNIYIKKKKEDSYELAATTSNNKYTLENLTSNTRYFIVVTGIDGSGGETPYSNEIEIVTKNILPGEPGEVLFTVDEAGSRIITWTPATDTDGIVEKYRVYTTQGGEKKLLGETKTETYTVAGDIAFDKIYVCAVDNMNDESGQVRAFELHGEEMHVTLFAEGILPLGKLGDITGPGPGLSAQFTLNNYVYPGLVLGVEAGFYTFTGKDSTYKKTGTSYMASLFFTAGYCFELNYYFSVTPYVSFGTTYFNSEFINRDKVTLNENDETISEMGPSICGGIEGGYRLTESFSLVLRMYAGFLTGADSGFYTGCGLGCMYRL